MDTANRGFQPEHVFRQFGEKWALVTAGNAERYNTMTVSWGGLGVLWGKPTATIYVRTTRYTHEFLDREDFFTISFFPAGLRSTLSMLGARSGRDMDKMHVPGLTIEPRERGIVFREATLTLVCRKLYRQRLDVGAMPEDVRRTYYADAAPHDMYIGEVVETLSRA